MGTQSGGADVKHGASSSAGPDGDYMSVDERAWPRVRCVIADVAVSDEALLRSVNVLGALAKRGERYTLLIDGRQARPLSARQRKLLAEAALPTAAFAARNCAGSAIVAGNAVLAGIITALQWIKPAGYPEKVFLSFDEAEAWLDARRDSPRGSST